MDEPFDPSKHDLPEVLQADLDAAALAHYFDELAMHAEVLEVRAKGGSEVTVGDATITLERGRALIEARAVHGVQVRYRREDGELWFDTLMVGPRGVRLVSMRAPIGTPAQSRDGGT